MLKFNFITIVVAVSDNSPAADAGIKPGDQISKFGTINAENFTSLRALSEVSRLHTNDSEGGGGGGGLTKGPGREMFFL
jgi:hypothetical protein